MNVPEDFAGDVHGLVQRLVEIADRVYLIGDGNPMPTIEQNAVDRDKAIREAGDAIRERLSDVANALGRIVDEMTNERRRKASVDARDR